MYRKEINSLWKAEMSMKAEGEIYRNENLYVSEGNTVERSPQKR